MKSIKITLIVTKNTSTLDFCLPFFHHLISKNQSFYISILFCCVSKKEILRNSTQYESLFKQLKIKNFDYIDFCYFKNFSSFLRAIVKSNLDYPPLTEFRSKLYQYDFSFITQFLGKLVNKILQIVIFRISRVNAILPKLNPDIIFFDNRSGYKFLGSDKIYNYMYLNKKPVYLIPHAPHMRHPTSEFCPFDEEGDELPYFCRFLYSYKFSTPWVGRENKRGQFFYSGYPGLDSLWLKKHVGSENNSKIWKNGAVVFAIRKFLPKGVERKPNTDDYVMDFEEVLKATKLVQKILTAIKYTKDIIIKPHPSNNINDIYDLMSYFPRITFQISNEPMYSLLKDTGIVICLPSTVALISAYSGVPTCIIECRLQNTIDTTWEKLKNLYDETTIRINDDNVLEMERLVLAKKFNKIRKHYPDGSSKLIEDMLNVDIKI